MNEFWLFRVIGLVRIWILSLTVNTGALVSESTASVGHVGDGRELSLLPSEFSAVCSLSQNFEISH